MPEHVTKSNTNQKILLHTIVPGTRLSARAATLLAALAVRMGVTFLADAAEYEMYSYRDNWNNVHVQETWPLGCLNLLLDANQTHKTARKESNAEKPNSPHRLFKTLDVALFECLVALKTLEISLDAEPTIHIPWTPKKAVCPIGPLFTCQLCQYPRSVTIMGPDAKCGICLGLDPLESLDSNKARIEIGASHDTTPSSDATWVE
ncbi:uncharacterized protein DSM5745_04475 [Aspergillus mulundensis]|uniref:Uncharacterized protein n=1 Tax=Aspergillus mulundensis TaxID=1810919 RepID=A0A3D8SCW7_9EURO|nr:hypothetical protein DSM5745_04475 [Aspergillus mulundensis]RDW84149.1 hypothetical protein DSM5745_04475 [Aspergillus mulundensis]